MTGSIYKLEIDCNESARQDILIAYADMAGIDGIEQGEQQLIIHSESRHSLEEYVDKIMTLSFMYPSSVVMQEIPNENWNKSWESSFQPIRVNDFCGIRASFHQSLVGVKHEIVINPELAFGTGHHETTYLMIEQMEHMDFDQKTVFDYGCGTAILSILAEQLGALEVQAIDIEEQAIKCAYDCISLNNSDRINLRTGTLDLIKKRYDTILANINRNVLMGSSEKLFKLLKGQGQLLLSGVLLTDLELVKAEYQRVGFLHEKTLIKGEWSAMLYSG